jgi:hypothetical protein
MECMFFSPQFFCITFIYLHMSIYLSSCYVYSISKKGKCYFWNWIEENFMTNKQKIYCNFNWPSYLSTG